ncbi:Branched-chain amino acid transport ATP-binding protein LivF (TC 3.A.1.4.1) [Patulibacter medicamentivorans]|uniref:Branched-chain amino acid transport ATP-binding protein LivF (TC 3.A.1.4.1) n=1 Tax=Patulibacter medicamentivorans TaxID=1097667 RepID=H0E6L8_9ACTN|nr:ABC transporter ATP-binding protein [Patulibacter medicamentivorans]EHN10665.1 Branched-chain amino acid transport ATP-binding protein LivF (TC 3.A.1.4.1) [Patulibacter medicamentivorans]
MSDGLKLDALVAGHGSVTALRSVDLDLAPGTVTAVLCPNGAGKTTMLETVAGLLPRLGGDVAVRGRSLPTGRPAAARARGVVLVPDDRALFTTLSVRENLAVARARSGPEPEAMLEYFPALEKRWTVSAGVLSGGEQQMLAVARALIQEPRVLLVDEMSMGLAPVIVEELLPIVRRVATDTGAVVVLVEQHVRLALEVADEAVVLAHGDVVLSGSAADLAADPGRLEAAYLGGRAET